MWYSVEVPEAAVLRVDGRLDRHLRYQPVVTVLDPLHDEVGCGLANVSKPGAAANATAYVTPERRRHGRRRISCASPKFADNSPLGRAADAAVRFAARDVTAPAHPRQFPVRPRPPGAADDLRRAARPTDAASQVNPATAVWEFHDKVNGATRCHEGAQGRCA